MRTGAHAVLHGTAAAAGSARPATVPFGPDGRGEALALSDRELSALRAHAVRWRPCWHCIFRQSDADPRPSFRVGKPTWRPGPLPPLGYRPALSAHARGRHRRLCDRGARGSEHELSSRPRAKCANAMVRRAYRRPTAQVPAVAADRLASAPHALFELVREHVALLEESHGAAQSCPAGLVRLLQSQACHCAFTTSAVGEGARVVGADRSRHASPSSPHSYSGGALWRPAVSGSVPAAGGAARRVRVSIPVRARTAVAGADRCGDVGPGRRPGCGRFEPRAAPL